MCFIKIADPEWAKEESSIFRKENAKSLGFVYLGIRLSPSKGNKIYKGNDLERRLEVMLNGALSGLPMAPLENGYRVTSDEMQECRETTSLRQNGVATWLLSVTLPHAFSGATANGYLDMWLRQAVKMVEAVGFTNETLLQAEIVLGIDKQPPKGHIFNAPRSAMGRPLLPNIFLGWYAEQVDMDAEHWTPSFQKLAERMEDLVAKQSGATKGFMEHGSLGGNLSKLIERAAPVEEFYKEAHKSWE